MDSYFDIGADEQKAVLQFGSQTLGLTENIIEKDIWLCWVLEQLFAMPDAPAMAFKGGTSLSKVFKVIDRFSEDVDVTLDYCFFELLNPFEPSLSKNQLKKFSERLRQHVKEFSLHRLVPYMQARLNTLADAAQCSIEASDDGEKIYIYYPSVASSTSDYVKEAVLLELGGRNAIEPNKQFTVTPYIQETLNTLQFPQATITVLDAERTFWEKATLIHVECQRGVRQSAERLSRHWYDLSKLYGNTIGQSALSDLVLLKDVVAHKSIFYSASYANYEACLQGDLRLIPEGEALKLLEKDYSKMVTAGMFYGDAPSFDELIAQLAQIQEHINNCIISE